MLYIVTLVTFLLWSIWTVRNGQLSWHSVVSIYVITLFAVDFGDVSFDFFFNLYDLPVHIVRNPVSDHYLGIIFADGMIFPLIAIIFVYYSVRFRRPWLLSFLFALLMGILEIGFVRLGFMVYHHWNEWLTTAITFIGFRVLAHFSHRLVSYPPQVSYRFRLVCFSYTFTEWPGAILSGTMLLYQWRPHLIENAFADDRFTAMIFATAMGGLAAYCSPTIQQKNKLFLFSGLGMASALFALLMHHIGLLYYNNWNDFWTIIRYVAPYLLIYWYDRWETDYSFKPS